MEGRKRMEDLIVIKQLPQIEEHLKELSIEIDEKVENAKKLVCTEENVKTIKQVRADLNKEFREVEHQRKTVKEQVLAPYMKFESIYKEYISDKYKNADNDLKQKINTVENELKAKKEQEIKNYFEEYKKANNIDFITYGQARINVTLTSSMKSLKEQVKEFIDKIAEDLKLIETQQHKEEILVEYKNTLNVSNAITTVMNRIEAVNQEREKQIVISVQSNEKHEITKESYEQLENVFSKKEKTYTITFKVTDNAVRLKQLKDYLIKEGYQYE